MIDQQCWLSGVSRKVQHTSIIASRLVQGGISDLQWTDLCELSVLFICTEYTWDQVCCRLSAFVSFFNINCVRQFLARQHSNKPTELPKALCVEEHECYTICSNNANIKYLFEFMALYACNTLQTWYHIFFSKITILSYIL